METTTPQSDEDLLIQGLKAGHEADYQKAVRLFTPGMMAVARFYLDNASAEETVKDCWVSVIDAIHKFEGRSGLKTWLHRIVANRAKNHIRKHKREVSADFSDSLDPELADRFAPNGRWATPPSLKSHDSAEALMENGALSDCLDQHPEAQRSALMLYEAHQHKSDDVCNILDVSASKLRVLLHRARQKIFLMVETFQETGGC